MMALGSYKAKNQMMLHQNQDSNTGNYTFMKVQCRRMVQFINFNLSNFIFELKEEYD